MATNRFQVELHNSLLDFSARHNAFVWHPPDGMGPWRPGDWMFGHRSNWGVIEAKQCQTNTLPLRDWTPQQRQFARQVGLAGGEYWLIVNFGRKKDQRGKVRVLSGRGALSEVTARGGISSSSIYLETLEWDGQHWGKLDWILG